MRINQTSVLGSVQALALNGGRLFTASAEGGLQIFTETGWKRFIPACTSSGSIASFRGKANLRQVRRPILIARPQEIPAGLPAPDRLATTCTVTSAANSGSGSLRSCLENQTAGDVILFSPAFFPPSAPVTIHVGPSTAAMAFSRQCHRGCIQCGCHPGRQQCFR